MTDDPAHRTPAAGPASWWSALLAGTRAGRAPWAVGAGIRAAVAAGAVLGGSAALGDLRAGGIAYLGVACAVGFLGHGALRARAARVAGQAAGAAVGMTVGALTPATTGWVVAVAAAVGALAGVVGRTGPASTGAAVMAVVGLAYTQFGRLDLPVWEPPALFCAGSALVLALELPGAVLHRGRAGREAVAQVFTAAADLLGTGPGPAGDAARHRLARASAEARTAVAGYRARPGASPLDAAWTEARDAAATAARLHALPAAAGGPPAPEVAELTGGWRRRSAELRTGRLDRWWTAAPAPPPARRRWAVPAPAGGPEALLLGARLGVCVALATALAGWLHPPAHAFWIPLTVAVVLRPEYGPVVLRSLHRLAGTVVGVGLVAGVLALGPSPAWLCLAAALALGIDALAAPRLYGLAVVGITGSALLSTGVADPSGVQPGARLLDTVLGCGIAALAGVLLWPRRGLPDAARAARATLAALARQVDGELGTGVPAAERAAATEAAYRAAHAWRDQLERDLAEPDPAHAAADWLPVAVQAERVVDVVCAAGEDARAGGGPPDAPVPPFDPGPGPLTPARTLAVLAELTGALGRRGGGQPPDPSTGWPAAAPPSSPSAPRRPGRRRRPG
ncbi:FUSC family protein [Modestobacter sp. NPDC049651]|uniref:FUSC family protein n=1 Tax=unclassified Modestobacter TaxID=2643866 RepID=UPI0034026B6C